MPRTITNIMQLPRNPGHSAPTYTIIPSDLSEARRVQDQIGQRLLANGCHGRELFGIQTALEEALVNAIKHGNQYDRSRTVQIAYRLLPDRFEVRITDEGTGFDPNDVPDPTAIENLERPCGRGLMLMRHYMTEVTFNQCGNTVTMCKVLRNDKQ